MNANRFFLLFFPFLFGSIMAIAQEKSPKNQTFTYNNVKWNTMEYDFGTIPFDEPVIFEFKFENLKESPMFIDNIRTTCGCAAPFWSYDPTASGDHAMVTIEYNAKKEGVFEKYIKVFFKDQKRPDIILVKGEVEADPNATE